jgi:tetratricopeptide (TPR) repeat protein
MSFRISAITIAASALVWMLISCSAAQEQSPQDPAADLKKGNYSAAIAGFQKALAANAGDQNAQEGLLQAFYETGRYREAEDAAKKFLVARTDNPGVQILVGEVYAATGRYREAADAFGKASQTAKDPQKLHSELRRGEMLLTTGQEEEAKKIFQAVIDLEDKIDETTAETLTYTAHALKHLEKYQEANNYFLDAIQTDGEYIDGHLGGGELFTSKYNYAEAAEFFDDALKINPNSARAHLGVARNKQIEGGDEMRQALMRALEINPNYVEAKTYSAFIEIEAERQDQAAKTIDEALKINPNSLDAHALRAALYYLQNKPAELEAEIRTTLAINPRWGELYETLSHFANNTRRYTQAVEFSRQAIKLQPRLWSAHLSLGNALLRTGQAEEGRKEVEESFEGDPFNVWAKNTLDLLDTMKEYRETKRGPFVLKTAPKETDVISVYAGDLLEEVSSKLAAKYKFTPKNPIWVEFFPDHADFAVRTLGLPGLGALGVCFGQVIAQDSPAARPSGEFNWGSTLWHEYTHVVSLQITDHLIPRWFSEGLSVYEERRSRPGWGDDWNLGHLKTYADGRWFKISELDGGFMRPKRPDDIQLAYFEASQICEFITEKYGFEAILDMLRRYRERQKTPEILQASLKLSESAFDAAFKEYIDSKVGPYLKAAASLQQTPGNTRLTKDVVLAQVKSKPDDFLLNLRAGTMLLAEGDPDGAIPYLKRSIELYPFQSGTGSANELLTQIYEKRGDRAATAAALEALVKVDENNYPAIKRLAQLRQELGDKNGALEAWKMSFYVNPFEVGGHTAAGELLLEANQPEPAMREFQVALALNPPNPAEAQYNLARAQLAAGRPAEAKRSVMRSLEAAPGFEKAQELLLRLVKP